MTAPRPADPGLPGRARAAAAPARREGRSQPEHALADRVRAAHAVAADPGQAGRRPSASRSARSSSRRPTGRLHVSRKTDYPVVSFDGSSEKWHVLGAGLFQGKIRAVVSTLGPRSRGVKTDKVVIEPGQMKLFYVIEGKVALQYNGERHVLEAGDSAYLDGGTAHGWENVGLQGRQGPLGHSGMKMAGHAGSTRPRWPTATCLGHVEDEGTSMSDQIVVDFRTEPARYKHWKLAFDGPVATLAMDVREDGGLVPGYELKLNSYDLGVDIELYDAIQRLRFEHPEVGAVVLTSGKERVFCAGANIRMLSQSSHGWKVNFCKFTNETRSAIEDASGRVPAGVAGRGERPVRGRRLRAGAGHRAHHHGRRRLHHGGAARGAAARGAARAPAGSPAWSTSAACAAIAPTSSARSRRASRASGRWSGGWSTRWCRARAWPRPRRQRAAELAARTDRPGRRPRHRARPARAADRGRPRRLRPRHLRDRPRAAAWPRSRWRRRPRRRPPTRPASTRRARASGRSRSRASSTT